MDRARLGATHVGGIGLVYYPPMRGRWHAAALAVALTLGVTGSFALGQALGHHAAAPVAAHHAAATRTITSAHGALSTASAPTPVPAAPAHTQPLSDSQHAKQQGGQREGGGDHHGGGHGDHHPKG